MLFRAVPLVVFVALVAFVVFAAPVPFVALTTLVALVVVFLLGFLEAEALGAAGFLEVETLGAAGFLVAVVLGAVGGVSLPVALAVVLAALVAVEDAVVLEGVESPVVNGASLTLALVMVTEVATLGVFAVFSGVLSPEGALAEVLFVLS